MSEQNTTALPTPGHNPGATVEQRFGAGAPARLVEKTTVVYDERHTRGMMAAAMFNDFLSRVPAHTKAKTGTQTAAAEAVAAADAILALIGR